MIWGGWVRPQPLQPPGRRTGSCSSSRFQREDLGRCAVSGKGGAFSSAAVRHPRVAASGRRRVAQPLHLVEVTRREGRQVTAVAPSAVCALHLPHRSRREITTRWSEIGRDRGELELGRSQCEATARSGEIDDLLHQRERVAAAPLQRLVRRVGRGGGRERAQVVLRRGDQGRSRGGETALARRPRREMTPRSGLEQRSGGGAPRQSGRGCPPPAPPSHRRDAPPLAAAAARWRAC